MEPFGLLEKGTASEKNQQRRKRDEKRAGTIQTARAEIGIMAPPVPVRR
jgi:hypothetical protein